MPRSAIPAGMAQICLRVYLAEAGQGSHAPGRWHSHPGSTRRTRRKSRVGVRVLASGGGLPVTAQLQKLKPAWCPLGVPWVVCTVTL